MKPEKQTQEYYDYHQCAKYIEEKYGYEIRDYAGKYTAKGKEIHNENLKVASEKYGYPYEKLLAQGDGTEEDNEIRRQVFDEADSKDPEYLDFWHSLVDYYDISNGCMIYMCFNQKEELCKYDWQERIFDDFMREFGGDMPDEAKFIRFEVWW